MIDVKAKDDAMTSIEIVNDEACDHVVTPGVSNFNCIANSRRVSDSSAPRKVVVIAIIMSTYNQTTNGGIASTTRETATGVLSYAQRSLNRIVPPESRQQAYDSTSAFASARPILFSFIFSQFILSFLPLLTFAIFSVSTVAFALGAAILFSLFWIGVAFMLLVPTLLVTSSIAVLVWGWAVGSFVVARWLYNHSPVGVQGDLQVDAAGKRVTIVKDSRGVDGEVKGTGW
ncbi:hypothetical protein G7046_g2629 [Stylonectria norvegica]|nr:hypothetical protein G7046_g2629 [Stylonectria norvegica]